MSTRQSLSSALILLSFGAVFLVAGLALPGLMSGAFAAVSGQGGSTVASALASNMANLIQVVFPFFGCGLIFAGVAKMLLYLFSATSQPENRVPSSSPETLAVRQFGAEPSFVRNTDVPTIKLSPAEQLLSRASHQVEDAEGKRSSLSGKIAAAFGKTSLTASSFLVPVDAAIDTVKSNAGTVSSLLSDKPDAKDLELAREAVSANEGVLSALDDLEDELLAAAMEDAVEESADVEGKVADMTARVRHYDVGRELLRS